MQNIDSLSIPQYRHICPTQLHHNYYEDWLGLRGKHHITKNLQNAHANCTTWNINNPTQTIWFTTHSSSSPVQGHFHSQCSINAHCVTSEDTALTILSKHTTFDLGILKICINNAMLPIPVHHPNKDPQSSLATHMDYEDMAAQLTPAPSSDTLFTSLPHSSQPDIIITITS